jgi:hypothetical protein
MARTRLQVQGELKLKDDGRTYRGVTSDAMLSTTSSLGLRVLRFTKAFGLLCGLLGDF